MDSPEKIPMSREEAELHHPSAQTEEVMPLRSGIEFVLENENIGRQAWYMVSEPFLIGARACKKVLDYIDRRVD
jgi:hypothetical protein